MEFQCEREQVRLLMANVTRDQIHFLIFKLHSLTGIVPIGAFLVLHFSINSLRTVGVWQYQLSIDVINNLPFLLFIEITFIIIPILFHSLVGFYIYFNGFYTKTYKLIF